MRAKNPSVGAHMSIWRTNFYKWIQIWLTDTKNVNFEPFLFGNNNKNIWQIAILFSIVWTKLHRHISLANSIGHQSSLRRRGNLDADSSAPFRDNLKQLL